MTETKGRSQRTIVCLHIPFSFRKSPSVVQTSYIYFPLEFTNRSSKVQEIWDLATFHQQSLHKNWGQGKRRGRNPETNRSFSLDLNGATPHCSDPALTITLQSIHCSCFLFTPELKKEFFLIKKLRKQLC